jgi:hypothetical protein
MGRLTIDVAKDRVGDLRLILLRMHRQRMTALWRAWAVYVESHERLDDVEGALVEVRDLHDAIEQLGWFAPPEEASVTLTVHHEVLADARERLTAR